jgi:ABC-type Mn2+/Zn2+ transport system ATPase subunit
MQLLGELNAQGLAILLVCHELDTVRRSVKDVLWVSRGRITRGGAEEMLSAGFMKEMFDS